MSTHTPTPYRPETRPTPAQSTRTPDTSDSWVARCQRQFDPRNRSRLENLVDEENAWRITE